MPASVISQIRDVPPTEGNTYTALHNYDAKRLYSFMHDGAMATVGNSIGIFFSGVAVTLGVSSILLLSSKRGARSRRYYFLCTYTIILLLLLIAYETQTLIVCNIDTILFFQLDSRTQEYASILSRILFMTLVVIAGFTDGLLVWRCFLVQRALDHGSPKWRNIFWVFPACLWGVTVAAGTLSAILSGTISFKLATLAFASNIVLNIHATLFITIRLLLHRRMVIACVQDKKLAAQHTYIVGILLESAAINLPVTVAAAIGVRGNILEVIMFPIASAGQVLAAVLIIHQTALGRVFSQQKEAEISKLMEKRDEEHNISGDAESVT